MIEGVARARGGPRSIVLRCQRRGFPGGGWCDGGGDGGHGIAVLTPVSGDGGARGAAARSKVPTIIMRPPQQGHGGRWSAAAPAAGSASLRSTGGSVTGTGMAISSLACAIFFLQVALASSP